MKTACEIPAFNIFCTIRILTEVIIVSSIIKMDDHSHDSTWFCGFCYYDLLDE